MAKKRSLRVRRMSAKRLLSLVVVGILTASVFLTVWMLQQTQTFKQDAAQVGSLPAFSSLIDLETKIKATTSPDGQWKITEDDYNLCPNAAPPPENNNPVRNNSCDQAGVTWTAAAPGTLNVHQAHCLANQYSGNPDGGTGCEDETESESGDAWYLYGKVGDSTDPNDPFYTQSAANSQSAFVSSCNYNSAHCHDRGCLYSASDGPDVPTKVGGWLYNESQDTSCFGISTYQCGQRSDGSMFGGARNGWARAMGFAQGAINRRFARTGQMMDRRCALAIAVIEVREEWVKNGKENGWKNITVGQTGFSDNGSNPTNPGGNNPSQSAPTLTPLPSLTPAPTQPTTITPVNAARSMLIAAGFIGLITMGFMIFGL